MRTFPHIIHLLSNTTHHRLRAGVCGVMTIHHDETSPFLDRTTCTACIEVMTKAFPSLAAWSGHQLHNFD